MLDNSLNVHLCRIIALQNLVYLYGRVGRSNNVALWLIISNPALVGECQFSCLALETSSSHSAWVWFGIGIGIRAKPTVKRSSDPWYQPALCR